MTLGFLATALVSVTPWQQLDAVARTRQLQALAALPLEARFVAATEGFLGTPYAVSPLGEGAGLDADPLLRFDAADCLTMVETSMALASSASDAEVLPALSLIRYARAPAFDERLHVMEAQWLPVNQRRGLIEDVTRTVGGALTRRVSKRITEATWREKSAAALRVSPRAQVTGEFELDLVPAAAAPSVLANAPEGLIVVVVRADRPRFVSRITHVGVLIQKDTGPHLRHASRSFKKVIDEPLERYLRRNLEFGAWTVEGVSLFRFRAPAVVAPVAVADAGAPGAPVASSAAPAPPPRLDAEVPPAAPETERLRGCGCAAPGASPWWGLLLASRRRRSSPAEGRRSGARG
ncbi:MAG: DUF1460 domain-containing protein [Myxococcaceae bacterium]|nr:DUF1460 domain-containing protein [Myxococcaceae bacterium]MCA3010760.1 DUF1460 domain-containing protein [Myxococcaceae bacterium]